MTTGHSSPSEPQKVVCLSVTETDDPSHDAHLLREVIGVLLEYPGRDRVNLDIRTGEKRVRMDLPMVNTGYCDGLHTRLEELLGPDTVAVHQELGLGMEPPSATPVNMPLEANPEPSLKPTPDTASEITVGSQSTPAAGVEAPEAVPADVFTPVGAEAAGDEPPF